MTSLLVGLIEQLLQIMQGSNLFILSELGNPGYIFTSRFVRLRLLRDCSMKGSRLKYISNSYRRLCARWPTSSAFKIRAFTGIVDNSSAPTSRVAVRG